MTSLRVISRTSRLPSSCGQMSCRVAMAGAKPQLFLCGHAIKSLQEGSKVVIRG